MYEFIARISCPALFKIPQRDGQSLLADRIRRRDSREGSVKQFCSVLLFCIYLIVTEANETGSAAQNND